MAFLGRGAEEDDGAGHRIGILFVQDMEGEEGSDRGGRDEVVPARMTDAGQGVVFGEDRDRPPPAVAGRRPQRRLGAEESRFDGDSAGLQHRGDRCDGFVLLEGRFGKPVDRVEQARDLRLGSGEVGLDARRARRGGTGELRGPFRGLPRPIAGLGGDLIEIALVGSSNVTEVSPGAHESQA